MDHKMADWSESDFLSSSNTHAYSASFNNSINNDIKRDDYDFEQIPDFEFDTAFKNFEANNSSNAFENFEANNNNDSVVFEDNGYGGHGNLSYDQPSQHGHNGQQSFSASTGSNSLQFFAAPSGIDSNSYLAAHTGLDGSSYQNTNQADGSFTAFANDNVEQAAEPVENDQSSAEKKGGRKQKGSAPSRSKDEQPDSDDEDDEYNSNAEEDDEDEGVEGKKKRKPYTEPRILTRWNTGQDQLLLIALKYECERRGITLPWGAALLHVNPDGKLDGLTQHLVKVRKARIYYGLPVPPPSKKDENKAEGPPKQYSEKEILNFATITYFKPGTEEDAKGTPGTLQRIITPQYMEIKPQLPYHGKPGWPLSLDVADDIMADLALRGSRWSQTTPLTIELQGGVRPAKKKGKSAKVIKVEQNEDDDDFTLKSTRKAQSTPTTSQKKKKAQTTTPSANKGSPAKPKGVTKSKKAPTPLTKTKARAAADKTPITAMTEKLAAAQVDSSPAKTPKKAAATPKKSTVTKKKGKVTKNTPPTPSSEEHKLTKPSLSLFSNIKQSHGQHGRREEHVRDEPDERLSESMSALPPLDFDTARNLELQALGPQADVSGVQNQSVHHQDQQMHHQDSQNFGTQSAMPNMPDQSMERQIDFANNMPQVPMPGMPDQSMQHQGGQVSGLQPTMSDHPTQHQGGQMFGLQPAVANAPVFMIQNQGNYGFNGYGQQMPSAPMYHHGQHMQNMQNVQQNHGQPFQTQGGQNVQNVQQNHGQPFQTQGGQNYMINNTPQMMPQMNPTMQQMFNAFVQQQFGTGQNFTGVGVDTGPMAREPLPNFDTEMDNYMTSTGHSATETPHQSLDDSCAQTNSASPNIVDSKPQTLTDADLSADMLTGMHDQLDDGNFGGFDLDEYL